MNSTLQIERLDHHGVVVGIIEELELVEQIDTRLGTDDQETVSAGEAVKAMILNGLGFSNRPLMLTPQFYENLPLETLFRAGVKAEDFNRHKLGRTLDQAYHYGCDLLFSELALSACAQEGVEVRYQSLDSTSFSLTGEYQCRDDEQAIEITYGHSKDHRPDLKQAVQALLVSQDGGVPLWMKSHDGNASDNEIFRERASALVDEFSQSEGPCYLIADSKLYTKKGAEMLSKLGFVSRIPGTLALESSTIEAALSQPQHWIELSATYRYQGVELEHYGIKQRWLVIHSDGAYQRARETIFKAERKEYQRLTKDLFHLQARRFLSAEQAVAALNELTSKLKYHGVDNLELSEHKHYRGPGRPSAHTNVDHRQWQIQAQPQVNESSLEAARQQKACFIIATNVDTEQLSDAEVFQAYKNQSHVERGFRFLKEPVFFTSSLFLKKPSRIEGLLMIMTLSLLVYSLAQRRLRTQLADTQQTLPNQIDIPTSTPTLRWVFQMLEGIHQVVMVESGVIKTLIHGLNDLREKILRLFGQGVCEKYQISWSGG